MTDMTHSVRKLSKSPDRSESIAGVSQKLEGQTRRVYVLSNELVGRIRERQIEYDQTSEVEIVRQLLNGELALAMCPIPTLSAAKTPKA